MKNFRDIFTVIVFVATSVLLPANPAVAAVCSLPGSGTSSDPWLVASASDFQKVGDSPCLASDYYKQSADITLVSPSSDLVPNGFAGTYDGDLYSINLSGGWSDGTYTQPYGLFGTNISGTIKKLRLTGEYKTSSYWGQPLALTIKSGGLISQVSSDVNVTVTGNADTIKLTGMVQRLARGATMEYSRSSGILSWEPSTSGSRYSYFGGLVLEIGLDENQLGASNPRKVELRDSYSSVTFKFPDNQRCQVTAGGLAGMQPTVSGDVYIVRSYSASKFAAGTNLTACGSIYPAVGGLIGRSDPGKYASASNDTTYTFLVSSYWAKDLIGGSNYSIGYPKTGDTNQFVSSLPRGVGLDSSYLKTVSTFQSKESSTPGLPDSNANLAIDSSTGTYSTDGTLDANEASYRWAIENGNVETFIPPTYTSLGSFLTRVKFADTSISQSMSGRGQVLEGPVTNYPELGRVWEICGTENGGFPVLVWEEKCKPVSSSAATEANATSSSAKSYSNNAQLAATGNSRSSNLVLTVFAISLTFIGSLFMRRASGIAKRK